MVGEVGLGQILIVFGIFVALFGYKKFPELGKGLGRGLREMRKAVHDPDEIDVTPPGRSETAAVQDEVGQI